jgi:A/G-specific adenine glycosylase
LEWYAVHKRELPWRRARDAYAVWISEAMLQQTRVEAVVPFYERFMRRFPSVEALAEAEVEEVLGAWSGLGYYSRARRLHAAAAVIVELHGGKFPSGRAEAEALPGVGSYTAGAVLSIAHGLEEWLVDGNVRRVLARWFAVEGVVTKAGPRREIEELAAALVAGVGDPGAWNQALMELGATLCLPRRPRCGECPVASVCRARALGVESVLPELPARPQAVAVELEVFLVEEGGRVLLRRRAEDGRMAGLWELPTREVTAGEGLLFSLEVGVEFIRCVELGELRHSITRHRIRARVISASVGSSGLPQGWAWVERGEVEGLGATGMTLKALRMGSTRAR